jgi:hypothetical protein
MAPWFEDQGYSLPRYRVAIGFPSTGKRGKRIGECWDGRASADGTFEVLIRPDQSDPIEVAAILAHELVHAAVGLECGHNPTLNARYAAALLGNYRRQTGSWADAVGLYHSHTLALAEAYRCRVAHALQPNTRLKNCAP